MLRQPELCSLQHEANAGSPGCCQGAYRVQARTVMHDVIPHDAQQLQQPQALLAMAQLLAEMQLQAFQRLQQGAHAAHARQQPEPARSPTLPTPAPASAGSRQHVAAQPGGACSANGLQGGAQTLTPERAAAADHEQRIAQIEARLCGLLAGERQPLAQLSNPINALGHISNAAGDPEIGPAGACERPAPAKLAVRSRGARAPVRHEATTQTEQDGRHLDRLQVLPEARRSVLVMACHDSLAHNLKSHNAVKGYASMRYVAIAFWGLRNHLCACCWSP